MKITPKPVTVQEYTLELSREQLVQLGLLSYRAESGVEPRFHELLPDDIRALILSLNASVTRPGVYNRGVWKS